MSTRQTIIEGAARTMFVDAWARFEEERQRTYPGQDLMHVAPPTPPEALRQAEEVICTIENMNHCGVETLWERANTACMVRLFERRRERAAKRLPPLPGPCGPHHDLSTFAHYLMMESLGHGVAWADDHAEYPHSTPLIETIWDGSSLSLSTMSTRKHMTEHEKRLHFEAKDRVYNDLKTSGNWPAKTCADCTARGYGGPAGVAACCQSFGHHRGDNCLHCGNDERGPQRKTR